jgi:D-alanyl-D-alanine carboxypeptidase/D-alanyl-D-alanine-endopeptidase (penicillin-binding protein 4)
LSIQGFDHAMRPRSVLLTALLSLLPLAAAPAFAVEPAPTEEVDGLPPGARLRLDDLQSLTKDRMFRDAKVAIDVVDLHDGNQVFSWKPNEAMLPASTMKVLTAAAALKELGPSYRFTTEVLTDGHLNVAGVLEGDLYVRGNGDPTLVLERLWKLIYDLRLEGVKEVAGNVFFDDSAFDRSNSIPGWNKREDIKRGPSYFAPIGALSLNFNTVAVIVGPGETVGGEARVQLETESPGVVEIDNQLLTGVPGSRRWVRIEREAHRRGMTLALKGRVPIGSGTLRYYRSVVDPTAHFVAAFSSLMEQHGIKVQGHFLESGVPERGVRTLVQLRSPPLAAILMEMNKYSSNFTAEQVLKAVGASGGGLPGTTQKGLTVIEDYLTSLGIPSSEYKLVNGSGLSRTIEIRPSHLTRVLADMAADPQVGHEFMASLSIGGRDGTLWARFQEEDQVGRLRGKTGTINGVHCLAGYIEAADGGMYAFAYLVNDLPRSIAVARRAHDAFVGAFMEPVEPGATE